MNGTKRPVKAWLEPATYSALRMWAAAIPGMTISKLVGVAVRRELARLQAQQKPLDVTEPRPSGGADGRGNRPPRGERGERIEVSRDGYERWRRERAEARATQDSEAGQ